MNESSTKTAKTNPMEWPSFLDATVLDVVRNDFKFPAMTPVQVRPSDK